MQRSERNKAEEDSGEKRGKDCENGKEKDENELGM